MPTYGTKPKRRQKTAKAINRRVIVPGSFCEQCGETKWKYLNVDHIIPCAMLKDMGIDFYRDDDNIRILCYVCNQKKQARLDFSDPRTIPLLRKYLDEVEKRPLLGEPLDFVFEMQDYEGKPHHDKHGGATRSDIHTNTIIQ